MSRMFIVALCVTLMLVPFALSAQNLLDEPESVAFDSVYNRYLVSNIDGGSIVAIDSVGNQSYFRAGLSACFSNHLEGDLLYVSIAGGVAGFNLSTTDIDWFWTAPAGFGTDGLTADTSGYLYAVSPGFRRIYKIKISDQSSTTLVDAGLPASPQDIIFDIRHNRLLVGCYVLNAPIIAVDCNTGALTTLVTTPTHAHDGISIDPDGNVYLGCGATGTVYMYDSTFTNPPKLLASGYTHVAGIDYNRFDSVLAVPDFEADSVGFIDLRQPVLELVGYDVDDTGGDSDGVVDVGETVGLSMLIGNTGGNAYDVAAELSTEDAMVSITQASITVADLVGAQGQVSSKGMFEIVVDPLCPDPYIAVFELSTTVEGEENLVESIYVHIGANSGFEDACESGEGFWQHSPVSDGFADQWHLDSNRSYSGEYSWKAGGLLAAPYDNGHDAGLVTQPVLIPDECLLSFWHYMDVDESGEPGETSDGGIIMIAGTDGEWTAVTPVGGYTHVVASGSESPFDDGTACYSGNIEWQEVQVDLSAWSGVVQVMFRFGSDASAVAEGWYLDDISLKRDGCCGMYNGGMTGNANCSEDGKSTLSDITRLIDRVYVSGEDLCCEESGNTNGSPDGKLTLSDITVLIDNVYISMEPTAACP